MAMLTWKLLNANDSIWAIKYVVLHQNFAHFTLRIFIVQ